MDTCLNSKRVIRELDQLIAWRGKPKYIRVDNGPEFISAALQAWANDREITFIFIEAGKPQQNGYVERFNRSFREEVLDAYNFERIREAQAMAHAWLWIYNNVRPHSSLGYVTPVAFLNERVKGLEGAFSTEHKLFYTRAMNMLLRIVTIFINLTQVPFFERYWTIWI
jgi:putative transposase